MLQSLMLFLILPMIGLASVLTFLRLVIGPTIADRVIALDLLATMGIGIVAAYAIATNQAAFMDIAIIVALIGFLGTVAFAYYLERRV